MAQIALPLTDMTKNVCSRSFVFNDTQRAAFVLLKKQLSSTAALSAPVFDRPFIIHTNSSDFAVGATLSQIDNDNIEKPIAFASQKLTEVQTRWATIEREAYAVIFALDKFGYIVFNSQIILYCDHNPLIYLVNCASEH